jgi:hypothetical protein
LPASLRFPSSEQHLSPAALVEAAWHVPWEEARNRRIVRAVHWEPSGMWMVSPRFSLLWALGPGEWKRPGPDHHRHHRREADLAARVLMVALRRFEADNGQPAERLAQLVPKYLERIPNDPFDGSPFRYRLSKGEEIVWPDDPQAGAPAPGGAAPAVAPPALAGAAMGGGPPLMPLAPAEPLRKVPAGQGILWSVGSDGQDNGGQRQSTSSSPGHFGEDLIYLVPPNRKNRH